MVNEKSVLFSGLVGIIVALNPVECIGQNKHLGNPNYIINQNDRITRQMYEDIQRRNKQSFENAQKRNRQMYEDILRRNKQIHKDLEKERLNKQTPLSIKPIPLQVPQKYNPEVYIYSPNLKPSNYYTLGIN